MASTTAFTGSVPANYDKYLGPLLFEPYALDMAGRLQNDRLQKVLELACGTGRVTKHLLPLIAAEGTLVATDLNADMLAVAQTKIDDNRVQWQVVDAQELPFENGVFDHVICQFGVMFFPDKPKAFAETYRVLQPGGKFLFNVWDELKYNPYADTIRKVMDDMYKENAPDFFQKVPHGFFDKDEIEKKVLAAGFQNIKFDVVQKTSGFSNVDEFITGFVDGSPLRSFLMDKPAPEQNDLRQKLREALSAQSEQYGAHVPLQAISIEAIK
jgi:ubiquinone/menaquinone biosynthesis C-methylase UbiE